MDRAGGVGLGRPWRHHARCDSTNARLKELAAGGAPHGTVVTADEQTAGRGRQGRAWHAPAGRALLYSLLLRPIGDRPLLSLAAGIAVCETAEELMARARCAVKWPNDVLLDGRKLAGILIEARPPDDWAVIGVGLNLSIESDEFPPELRATAISIRGSHEAAAAAVLSRCLARWVDASDEAILAAWNERDALKGREVSWEEGSGIAGGVDGRGNLIVAVPGGGSVALSAGEVHLG